MDDSIGGGIWSKKTIFGLVEGIHVAICRVLSRFVAMSRLFLARTNAT